MAHVTAGYAAITGAAHHPLHSWSEIFATFTISTIFFVLADDALLLLMFILKNRQGPSGFS